MHRAFSTLLVAGVSLLGSFAANAATITVLNPFEYRQNQLANAGGFAAGDRIVFGANSVSPNGALGTTGTATQGATTANLFFRAFDTAPNQFIANVLTSTGLTGAWNLTFTNGLDTANATTPSIGAVGLMPLAFNLVTSGPLLTPTLSWTLPTSFTNVALEAIRILVYDLDDLVTLSNGITTNQQANSIFTSAQLAASATSYTFAGGVLNPDHRYLFSVSLNDLRDASLAFSNANTLSRSNAYLAYATTVPEPGTWALMLIGLSLFGIMARRRNAG